MFRKYIRYGVFLPIVALCEMVGCTDEPVTAGEAPVCWPGQPGCYGVTAGYGYPGAGGGYPQAQCLPHEQPCAGGCFDLSSSSLNCGACGVACAPDQVCSAGVCRDRGGKERRQDDREGECAH